MRKRRTVLAATMAAVVGGLTLVGIQMAIAATNAAPSLQYRIAVADLSLTPSQVGGSTVWTGNLTISVEKPAGMTPYTNGLWIRMRGLAPSLVLTNPRTQDCAFAVDGQFDNCMTQAPQAGEQRRKYVYSYALTGPAPFRPGAVAPTVEVRGITPVPGTTDQYVEGHAPIRVMPSA